MVLGSRGHGEQVERDAQRGEPLAKRRSSVGVPGIAGITPQFSGFSAGIGQLQDERVVGGLVVGHRVATTCSAAAKVATGEAEPEVRGRAALIARTDSMTAGRAALDPVALLARRLFAQTARVHPTQVAHQLRGEHIELLR